MAHTDYSDPVQVRRAYKFRAYPTRPQEGRAVRLLADHCDLYNPALEERREAWKMRHVSVSYSMQSVQLKEIRQADPDGQGRHSFTAQQQTLRRVNTVFNAFYDRARKGRAGYPRFKPYSRFSQAMFVAGDGAKWQPAADGRWARASFQAVGTIKVRQHRPVPGTVKTLQLKREGRRWYVVATVETQPVPLPPAGREIGVDVGVARFLTTSDGEVIGNPHFLIASAEVIADLQRRKDRARPGSGNRKRLKRVLAREGRKIRNRRRDFHHKTARALVAECDVIAIENLNTAGMTRRAEPKPDLAQPGAFLPNGAAAKSGLNRSIFDAGWAQFASILAGKAESITCHACGHRCERPRQDTVVCPCCGPHDADVNAALNIATRAGLGPGQVAAAA